MQNHANLSESPVPKAPELSRDQKVSLALMNFPAAGFPEMIWTDGPNGIRGVEGATAFPSGLAVAASFDQGLARRFGEALAGEALAAGRNSILGPGLDIARVPWAGRVAEALGEDPCLVGEIGGPIVAGLQSAGVVAAPKHYVANNFEYLRTGRGSQGRRTSAVDVRVSRRALREVYAEPFRRVLVKYGAASLLASYNRINGEYVSESKEILSILRDEWEWKGFIVPDFLYAVRDDEKALKAGLDFPALGGTAGRTIDMVNALPDNALEVIVERVRWSMAAANAVTAPTFTEPLNNGISQDLAQEILEDGAVLLKNTNDLLPLHPDALSSIVLPGIADPTHLLVMGGSAAVTLSPQRITPLATAFRNVFGPADINVVPGTLGDVPLPTLTADVVASAKDDVTGHTVAVDLDQFSLLDPPEGIGPDWSATLTSRYMPPVSGDYRFALDFSGEATLSADGKNVATGYREASPMLHGPAYPIQAVLTLQAGEPLILKVEFSSGPSFVIPDAVRPGLKLGLALPDQALTAAAEAARSADVAVVVVGRVSGEAMDVDSLHLPGDQEKLIRTVAKANPRTIVVTCGAGPVVMPWLDDVAAVLHVWNPGERFAPALARLLAGQAEPGGRLPLTFPVSEQLTPVSTPARYPGIYGAVDYDEDLLVGYAWYDATKTEPAFPFGHGLGYTQFEIGPIEVQIENEEVRIGIEVRNTGNRQGKVVPQVYVSSPAIAEHPLRRLRAFATAIIKADESKSLTLTIPINELTAYSEETGHYVLHEGDYTFSVGLSSRDIRISSTLAL